MRTAASNAPMGPTPIRNATVAKRRQTELSSDQNFDLQTIPQSLKRKANETPNTDTSDDPLLGSGGPTKKSARASFPGGLRERPTPNITKPQSGPNNPCNLHNSAKIDDLVRKISVLSQEARAMHEETSADLAQVNEGLDDIDGNVINLYEKVDCLATNEQGRDILNRMAVLESRVDMWGREITQRLSALDDLVIKRFDSIDRPLKELAKKPPVIVQHP